MNLGGSVFPNGMGVYKLVAEVSEFYNRHPTDINNFAVQYGNKFPPSIYFSAY
jgi:hypothetical protein